MRAGDQDGSSPLRHKVTRVATGQRLHDYPVRPVERRSVWLTLPCTLPSAADHAPAASRSKGVAWKGDLGMVTSLRSALRRRR
jgi:hypothetical protein